MYPSECQSDALLYQHERKSGIRKPEGCHPAFRQLFLDRNSFGDD
jgi:hypothetical protein